LSFYEGAGVRDLKIEESQLEVLCTDSTALDVTLSESYRIIPQVTKATSFIIIKQKAKDILHGLYTVIVHCTKTLP
jgi:hypothetical protein